MQAQEKSALYDRLGGIYTIATVVDAFIDRIMIDPRLNANPRIDEAHHRVPPAGFKYLVSEMVGWASGGQQHYSGRSMLDAHSDRERVTLIEETRLEPLAKPSAAVPVRTLRRVARPGSRAGGGADLGASGVTHQVQCQEKTPTIRAKKAASSRR